MRARWPAAVLVLLLLMSSLPPAGGLTAKEAAGGWSGMLPKGLDVGTAPTVELRNVTVPLAPGASAKAAFTVTLYDGSNLKISNVVLTLEIYRWGVLGTERELTNSSKPLPVFVTGDNDTVLGSTAAASYNGNLPDKATPWVYQVNVSVPQSAEMGFYRIRMRAEFVNASAIPKTASSRGYYDDATWASLLAAAGKKEDLSAVVPGLDGLLPEGGLTVAPRDFLYISRPNLVPDFGEFTTPTIRPGSSGTYNFTITNRYSEDITGVRLDVEVYMWATLESARSIERLGGPAPRFKDAGTYKVSIDIGTVTAKGTVPVRLDISTKGDTPKGTYFVRHRITFAHNGTTYTMSSRGYFTSAQWEGFNYNNLLYQLNVSGIVPDSSFNVKDPVPLWPLGVLVTLCVLFGALAVVFYLAEEHGSEYPRLKKALQYWSGKYQERRRLMQQRLDELRREVDVPLEDDEVK